MLGSILVHNDAFEQASAVIRPGDFYRDAHNRIYAAMKYLIEERHVAVDFVTLKEELTRRGELDEVGGPTYVAALMDGIPRTTNVKFYAGIIRDKKVLRDICFVANKALSAAYEAEEDPTALLAHIDRAFLNLQQHASVSAARDLRDAAKDISNYLDWRTQHRGENTGITTGFRCLDEMTFGWQVGDLIMVGARPSVGKTSLLLNCCTAAASTGKRTAIFSFEMKRKQLEFRIVSSLSGVALTRILGGFLGAADYPRLGEAFERIHAMPLVIDDQTGLTVSDVRARCRRLKAEGGLDLVGIDYVQLMPGSLDRRGATRTEEIADISRRLKTNIAEELGIPVIVLSQLRRLDGRRPTLEDLREGGSLEQDADIAILLHRKNYKESGRTEAILAKQRNGPTGTRYLHVDLDTVTFTDMPAEEQQAEPEAESEQAPRRRKRG